MTDKPTPEQIQRANALSQKVLRAEHWEVPLADTIAQLDAMQAERDEARAERAAANIRASELKLGFDKATADLAEIAALVKDVRPNDGERQLRNTLTAIAGKCWVETDLLVAEAQEMFSAMLRQNSPEGLAKVLGEFVAKRGLEIGGRHGTR